MEHGYPAGGGSTRAGKGAVAKVLLRRLVASKCEERDFVRKI